MSATLMSPSPARADCSISATTVTCSSAGGPQSTTVGTGAEDNFTVNVLNGATISVGPDAIGILLNGSNIVTNGGAIVAGNSTGGGLGISGGIVFIGDGNTAVNNGSVSVGSVDPLSGGQVFGIQSYGLNADITNNGTVTVGNGSGDAPYPFDATGIGATSNSRIVNNGSIIVGNFAQGIFACCNNQIINSAGALIQTGDNGVGIFAGTDNNQITNAGRIVVGSGINGGGGPFFSYGTLVSGSNNTVTNSGSIQVGNLGVGMAIDDPLGGGGLYGGNTLINAVGATIVGGDGSYGMASGSQFVFPPDATLTNHGTIIIGNAISGVSIPIGMVAFGPAAITNTGTIIVGNGDTGTFPVGIYALDAGSTVVNSGSVTVGTAGLGVRVAGDGSTFNNSGTITVGDGGTGVQVTSPVFGFNTTGPAATNSGSIFAGPGGTGINFVDNGSLINTGTIRATGDGSGGTGYSIFTCSCTTTTITNSGTLDGKIFAEGPSTTFVNSGLITITDTNAVQPIGPFNFNISDVGGAGGGSFTQTASGTLSLRVMPGATAPIDSLLADTITLAGTLRVAMQSGLYANRTITDTAVSLTGNGASRITTTFGSFLASSPFFTVTPIYDTGDATSYTAMSLQLDRIGFGALSGLTPNQQAVGNALERGYSPGLDPSGPVGQFYANLLLNGTPGFYDQLSGAGTAASQDAAFNVSDLFSVAMLQQAMAWLSGSSGAPGVTFGGLPYAPTANNRFAGRRGADAFAAMQPSEGRWRVWGSGFGATRSIDGQWGTADQRTDAAGGLFGVDRQIAPDLLIGAAVGASNSRFSVSSLSTSGHADAGHVGVYALKTFGAAYLAGALHYAHASNDTDRTISGIGITEQAKGSFDSDQFGGRLELGWRTAMRSITLTPFAAIAPTTLWQQGYSETSTTSTGAPGILGLTYQSNRVSSVPGFLGLQVDGRFTFDNGTTLLPFARVSWVHEFDTNRSVTASFINITGGSFTVEGASADANALRLEGGGSYALNPRASLFASVNSQLSSHSQSFAGMGGLRLGW
ncbi:MAG: autotransporter domain-containing protein [Pseudolabrys sp.]|nr:autotransporter domain-containing protein [Pseudolabrys sp.]